jgi:hypothetical protein
MIDLCPGCGDIVEEDEPEVYFDGTIWHLDCWESEPAR